mmetsp:Transcript_29789/g.86396  ORF Transcript_29789/g.86396 Transcript_29789/m.86396 type:complete len:254 (+) Transcript_29789:376-1137(+)
MCIRGMDNLCRQGYGGIFLGENSMRGNFTRETIVDARFAFILPPGMDPLSAVPFMCAGMTVYAPLREHVTGPDMRVGIISVGALGHLAVQFARVMGCQVSVFSTSPWKEPDCRQWGADRFVLSTDAAQMEAQANTCDLLVDCCHEAIDIKAYMNILRAGGKLAFVSILPPKDTPSIEVPLMPMVFGQKSVCGSIVAGTRDAMEMLRVAAAHGVTPSIETMPFTKVNEAIDRVLSGDHKGYRIVLTHDNDNTHN